MKGLGASDNHFFAFCQHNVVVRYFMDFWLPIEIEFKTSTINSLPNNQLPLYLFRYPFFHVVSLFVTILMDRRDFYNMRDYFLHWINWENLNRKDSFFDWLWINIKTRQARITNQFSKLFSLLFECNLFLDTRYKYNLFRSFAIFVLHT